MSLHANLSFVFHQVAEIKLNINALFYALKNEIEQGHKKREQKEKIGFSSVCLCTRGKMYSVEYEVVFYL